MRNKFIIGAVDDVVIVLQGQELEPAVFIGGNTKEKYLMRPGSMAKATKPFPANIGIAVKGLEYQ